MGEAKSKTPFGAAATDGSAPAEPVVLKKGMAIKLKGLQGNPELNGTPGEIVDYHEEKKRFIVKVEAKRCFSVPTTSSRREHDCRRPPSTSVGSALDFFRACFNI